MSCLTMKSPSIESEFFSSLSFGGSSRSAVEAAALPSSDVDNDATRESLDCFDDSAMSTVARPNEDPQGFGSDVGGAQTENIPSSNDLTEELSTVDKDDFVFVSFVDANFLSYGVMEDMTTSQTESPITTIVDTSETSLSPHGRDSAKFETSDQDRCIIRAELDSAANVVFNNTPAVEWNMANLDEGLKGRVYSISDNAGRNALTNNTFAPSVIDNEAGIVNADLTVGADLMSNIIDVTQLTDGSSTAKTCHVANNFYLDVYKFALNKKVHEGELTNTNERNKRTNRRRRRIGNTRKWKANSLCEDVIGNFEFSLFPYRAEHMTTDADELAYMDEQLAKLEESARLVCDETAVASVPESTDLRMTSPQSLVQIVTDIIDKTITLQSNPQTQCSVLAMGSVRTPVSDSEKSKNDKELEGRQKLEHKGEPTLYFCDARYDLRTTYEDELCTRHTSRSLTVDGLFDLQDRGAVVRLRRKKKWRTEKARIQLKTKYCQSVRNTAHGRAYYVHHRVSKLMRMCDGKLPYSSTRQLSTRQIDKTKGCTVGVLKENLKMLPKSTAPAETSRSVVRPPPVALAPRYAMNRNNADAALSADLINILITMQDRDLSPEDYELLLRLDDRVAPKTIDASRLNQLRTDIVGEERVDLDNFKNEDVCTVCMDMYEVGQVRKYLPCGHGFHAACIDGWLMNASVNCPLDGQEVRL